MIGWLFLRRAVVPNKTTENFTVSASRYTPQPIPEHSAVTIAKISNHDGRG